MADSKNGLNNKQAAGCAQCIAAFPAALVWYFLFGAMLHKTGAGVMEWSLFVGYLVCSVLGMALAIVFKFTD